MSKEKALNRGVPEGYVFGVQLVDAKDAEEARKRGERILATQDLIVVPGCERPESPQTLYKSWHPEPCGFTIYRRRKA